MALFNKQSSEEKAQQKQEKLDALLKKNGLDNLSEDIKTQVYDIFNVDLAGTGLMEMGTLLGGNSTKDNNQLIKEYTVAMMHQNWIIIKLLDDLRKK